MLLPGQPAPAASAKDQNGNSISTADLKGRKVILFFYPEDGTPTCTTEACNLRDNYADIKALGYEVYGVSMDSEKKHQSFIAKHQLPYTLISDPARSFIEAFGAWGEKQMYGKKYMGILRSTFVLNESGTITHVIAKVKAKEHAQQLREVLAV